jgi:hypothetical protein
MIMFQRKRNFQHRLLPGGGLFSAPTPLPPPPPPPPPPERDDPEIAASRDRPARLPDAMPDLHQQKEDRICPLP